MIQRHRIFRHTPPWTPGLLFCAILTGQQVSVAETGYPPPPGAYRSEPAAQMEPTRPSPQATSPGADVGGRESTQSSSRLLPLPDDMFGAKRERYDADNLFGSPTPVRQGGPIHPGYPSYAPGYSAYQQQHRGPYYPGATTGYAPDYGYAQEGGPGGGAIPETLPGAPLSAQPAKSGDSSVFRPPE